MCVGVSVFSGELFHPQATPCSITLSEHRLVANCSSLVYVDHRPTDAPSGLSSQRRVHTHPSTGRAPSRRADAVQVRGETLPRPLLRQQAQLVRLTGNELQIVLHPHIIINCLSVAFHWKGDYHLWFKKRFENKIPSWGSSMKPLYHLWLVARFPIFISHVAIMHAGYYSHRSLMDVDVTRTLRNAE